MVDIFAHYLCSHIGSLLHLRVSQKCGFLTNFVGYNLP